MFVKLLKHQESRLGSEWHPGVPWPRYSRLSCCMVCVCDRQCTHLCFSGKAPLSTRPPNITSMSLHMITFTRPSQVLVLQATMLGYQARSMVCLLYGCTLSHVSSCLTMGAIEIRIFLIACSQQLHSGITFNFYMGLSHVCVGVLPHKNNYMLVLLLPW